MKVAHILVLLLVGVATLAVAFSPLVKPTPVAHDHGGTLTVFDQFCDGHPDNPMPLRCARVVWCWSHQRKEAVDWPLDEAITFLKELEAHTW